MATVRLTLTNRSTRSATFALEPLGDYCELVPGQSVTAVYDTTDLAPHLELTIDDDGRQSARNPATASGWHLSGTIAAASIGPRRD